LGTRREDSDGSVSVFKRPRTHLPHFRLENGFLPCPFASMAVTMDWEGSKHAKAFCCNTWSFLFEIGGSIREMQKFLNLFSPVIQSYGGS